VETTGTGPSVADIADRDVELAQRFADIARQIEAQGDRETTWQRIVDMASDVLPVFEHAAVSLVHPKGGIDTPAATGEVPRRVDALQYETGEGPCLSAIREHDVFVTGDLGCEERWPRFSRRAVDETGIRSMLAFRLFLEEETLGALNLYSTRTDAFDERARALGAVLAAHAAVAMSAATGQEQTEQLEAALTSSREIGMALGIVMTQSRLDRAGAFRALSQASQRMNVKLRDLAAAIVTGHEASIRPAPTAVSTRVNGMDAAAAPAHHQEES
jgi:transcriptional regulator with GAF, ATPase, and Fis domain